MNEETRVDRVYLLMRKYPIFKKRSILERVLHAHDHPTRKHDPSINTGISVVSIGTIIADYLQFAIEAQRIK